MEVAFDTTSTTPLNSYPLQSEPQSTNAVLVDALLSDGGETEASVDLLSDPSALLSFNAKKIYDAIQEAIKQYSPKEVTPVDDTDRTPESTAQFIVSSIAQLFDAYAKSNPELSADEQIEKFIAAARSGVQTGYDDAYNILEGLGAFTIEGVKSGVEQTKIEIEKGLTSLEKYLKEQYGTADSKAESDTPVE